MIRTILPAVALLSILIGPLATAEDAKEWLVVGYVAGDPAEENTCVTVFDDGHAAYTYGEETTPRLKLGRKALAALEGLDKEEILAEAAKLAPLLEGRDDVAMYALCFDGVCHDFPRYLADDEGGEALSPEMRQVLTELDGVFWAAFRGDYRQRFLPRPPRHNAGESQ
ncbi:MAG: hypothetical protein AAF604_23130 [Acidobacteriota bacterium]